MATALRQAPSAQTLLCQALLQASQPLIEQAHVKRQPRASGGRGAKGGRGASDGRGAKGGRTKGSGRPNQTQSSQTPLEQTAAASTASTASTHALPEQALKQLPWAVIGREVLELHQAYTRGRVENAGRQQGAFGKQENPLHDRLLGGQFYFLPRNIQRVRLVLRSLPWQTSHGRTSFGKTPPTDWLLASWLQPNPTSERTPNPSKETPHTPPTQTLRQAEEDGGLAAEPSAAGQALKSSAAAGQVLKPAAAGQALEPAAGQVLKPQATAEPSARAGQALEPSAAEQALESQATAGQALESQATAEPSAAEQVLKPSAAAGQALESQATAGQALESQATAEPSARAAQVLKPSAAAEPSATAAQALKPSAAGQVLKPSAAEQVLKPSAAAGQALKPQAAAGQALKPQATTTLAAAISTSTTPRPNLPPHPPKPTQILRVLDLGCGTGAFSLAVLDFLRDLGPPAQGWPQVDITLVDQSRRSLGQARRNLRAYAALALPDLHLSMQSYAHGAQTFLDDHTQRPQYAMAGAAMVMNELAVLGPRRTSKKAARLAASMQRVVMPTGIWLVVEAGVRKGYMQMMALRQQWLKQGVVLYPCTHQKPCPLWRPTVRQWCHTSQYLPKDFFFDTLLRERAGIDFRMDDLNASSLVVQFGGPVPSSAVAPARGESPSTRQWVSKRLGLPTPTTPQAQQPLSQAQAPFRSPYGARVLSHPMPANKAAALIGSHARLQHTPPKHAKPLHALLSCEENGQLGLREATPKVAIFRGQLVKPYALELQRIPLQMMPVYQPRRKGGVSSPALPKKTAARAKKTAP